MVSIRGPKSALSSFIEENNIKPIKRDERPIRNVPIKPKIKKHRLKPEVEQINISKQLQSLEDLACATIYASINEPDFKPLNNECLDLFSKYLSRRRLVNVDIFKFLVMSASTELCIYDCSMIEDTEYLRIKEKTELSKLELHFCGQLSQETLDLILESVNLTILSISGGFLIQNIKVTKDMKSIDVSDCSRLGDSFINNLTTLEYLNLTNCIGLEESILNFGVKELILDGCFIKDTFLSKLKPSVLKKLSLNMCKNILPSNISTMSENFMNKFFVKCKNLEELSVEGISTITRIPAYKNLKALNVAYCYDFNVNCIFSCSKLEILNIARVNLSKDVLKQLVCFKELRILDLSWSENLDDDILSFLVDGLNKIEIISVFGCFDLTIKAGEIAWSMNHNVKIIGCPSETRYLLNR